MDTLVKMQDQEFLPVRNVHGQEYELKRSYLYGVIITAWIFQVLAVLLNLCGYLIHPIAVEKSVRNKMFIYVCGRRFPKNGNTSVWFLMFFIKNVYL